MKITVNKSKNKEFKQGDIFQGVSGTLYQIVKDSNNKYRALDLKRCEIRSDVKETANDIVKSFVTESDIHYLYEDIEMVIK